MNILVIGGSNNLTDLLIKSFNKEGHRVSVLTGSYNSKSKYPHIFERYDFPYNTELLPEIFDSVTPDITFFTGAYDPCTAWLDPSHDSVTYVSSVMNIMMAFSSQKRGRFVYLSDDSVYSALDGVIYSEEDDMNSLDTRGAAMVQAESICRKFSSNPLLDIIILRLSGYYHLPKTIHDLDEAISEMCLNMLKTGSSGAKPSRLIMPISDSDAAFFITLVSLSATHKYSCYNISSGKTYTVPELEGMIRDFAEKSGFDIPDGEPEEKPDDNKRHKGLFSRVKGRVEIGMTAVSDKVIGAGAKDRRCYTDLPQSILDIQRFRNEFGINRLSDFRQDIGKIVSHMIRNKEEFLNIHVKRQPIIEWLKEKLGWAFHAAVPFVENFICFIPFFMLNNRAVGSQYFAKIDFFLLYVLLFAVTYGQHQATLSALLATLGYIFRQMYTRTGGEVLMDYNTYVWIAQLFIVGLTVGYLRDRLFAQKNEALQDHDHMIKQIDDIREINGSNVRVKDALQVQLINHDDSIGKIYDITSTLDRYSSEEVLFYATDILRRIMGSDDIALYRVMGGAYARLFTATSELARKLGNSIKYEDLGEIYEKLSGGKPFINRALNENYPMMSSAIYENDEIRLIIMIWKLPWEKMTLGQANILTVTGSLIQNAVLRANRYLDAIHEERYLDNTMILTKEAFSEMAEIYENAADHGLTEFVMYKILTSGNIDLKSMSEKLYTLVRQSDYLGIDDDDDLCIILTNTTKQSSAPAIERLSKAGIATEFIAS